jgi:DNA-binding MarR family transcriptional regulator
LTVKGKKLVDQMVENRRGLIEAIVDNLPLEKRQATIEAITLLVGSAREYEKNHYENIEKP